MVKHSSIFQTFVNYGHKKFYNIDTSWEPVQAEHEGIAEVSVESYDGGGRPQVQRVEVDSPAWKRFTKNALA
jgi:hypothetical protein